MPDWAPNPHPFLVHFPIALLAAGAAVDLLGLLRPSHRATRDTATWLFCAGALAAMAAYFSGLSAAAAVRVTPDAALAVTAHFAWADRTTWFFVFFASLRLSVSYIWRTTARWAIASSCVLSVVGVALLAATVLHGSRLVFQYGLGVESVPPAGAPWTLPRRPPAAGSRCQAPGGFRGNPSGVRAVLPRRRPAARGSAGRRPTSGCRRRLYCEDSGSASSRPISRVHVT